MRIATVYNHQLTSVLKPCSMDTTRWLRMSETFAHFGFEVDVILNSKCQSLRRSENLRFVSVDRVDWNDYDVIKTSYHSGFEFLKKHGGANHPFIVSLLGSVVGENDCVPGVYFFKDKRRELFELQKDIAERCRYVSVLTEKSRDLWIRCHGKADKVLLVPTGVNRNIPPPGANPYRKFGEKIAIYIGNIYTGEAQRDLNLLWQSRLNTLGRMLKRKGIRLCFIGTGDVDEIDHEAVTCLGKIENDQIWNYQYFAGAAIVFAQGKIQMNESSKIYYYLRSGLPVVSESPVPNNHLIEAAKCGFIVSHLDHQTMAARVEEAISRKWDRQSAVEYMLQHHTWEKRVALYRSHLT